MTEPALFHDGELYLQGLLGPDNVKHAKALGSEKITKELSQDSKDFIKHRHMAFISSWNRENGEVWCTPVFACPKKETFYQTLSEKPVASNRGEDVDPLSKHLDPCRICPSSTSNVLSSNFPTFAQLVEPLDDIHIKIHSTPIEGDPAWSNLKKGDWISVNYMELETRKRFRTNGIMKVDISSDGIVYENNESFTTCPKYIQQRKRSLPGFPRIASTTIQSGCEGDLTPELMDFISNADTFFIATVSPKHGADSSHRGGRPGFVRIIDKNILCWGDYLGKNMFQTLGNTVQHPITGLLFLDFINGHILQLSGKLSIESLETQSGLDHTSRNVIYSISKWRWTRNVAPFVWKMISYSSHLPPLVNVSVKLNSHRVMTQNHSKIPFKSLGVQIVSTKYESTNVKTFCLKLSDTVRIESGQYATFTFDIDGEYFQRCWTVSSGTYVLLPGMNEDLLLTNYLEISVKLKENGKVTPWLFSAPLGTRFQLLGCEGGFTLDESESILKKYQQKDDKRDKWWKILFLSAGIGLTPMIANVRGLLKTFNEMEGDIQGFPDILWVHSEKTFDSLPFKDDLHHFVQNGIKIHFAITKGTQTDVKEVKSAFAGCEVITKRIDKDYIDSLCPDLVDRVCYLCGPSEFMKNMVNRLEELKVPDQHLVTESFDY